MGMMPMATHIANEGDPASAAIIQIPKPMRQTAIAVDAAFSITGKLDRFCVAPTTGRPGPLIPSPSVRGIYDATASPVHSETSYSNNAFRVIFLEPVFRSVRILRTTLTWSGSPICQPVSTKISTVMVPLQLPFSPMGVFARAIGHLTVQRLHDPIRAVSVRPPRQ